MDDVRNGWNTAPACVLGTVWGTASIRTWRFRSAPCLACRSGRPSPRHCALDTCRNAPIVRAARASLWICGQRKGVAHMPTGPASSSQRYFDCFGTAGQTLLVTSQQLSVRAAATHHHLAAPSSRGSQPPFTGGKPGCNVKMEGRLKILGSKTTIFVMLVRVGHLRCLHSISAAHLLIRQ